MSMTGFGRSRRVMGELEILTEVKAVNHRYLDVSVKLPRVYSCFEQQIRRTVASRMQRGRVEILVTRVGAKGRLMDIQVDMDLAQRYHRALVTLVEKLDLAGRVKVSDLLTLPEVVVSVENEQAIEQEWIELDACLNQALTDIQTMRIQEAASLWADILPRVNCIANTAQEIGQLASLVPEAAREKLEKRLQDLTKGMEFDQNRLMQEVALMADRSDITEELTRLNSHVQQFISLGEAGSPVGRKLDFLLQELLREINTIGSKCASSRIAHHVVDIKAEIERIREQIQNIE